MNLKSFEKRPNDDSSLSGSGKIDLRIPGERRPDQEGAGLRRGDRPDVHQGGQEVGGGARGGGRPSGRGSGGLAGETRRRGGHACAGSRRGGRSPSAATRRWCWRASSAPSCSGSGSAISRSPTRCSCPRRSGCGPRRAASCSEGDLWTDVKVSFLRVTAGFLLSALLAIPIGVTMGAFKVGEGLLQPLTEFVRYIPVPALIPLMMVMFGIGEMPKMMLIFVGTFFQLVLMVADEVRRVPYELIQVGYTLGAKRREIVAAYPVAGGPAGCLRRAAAVQRLGLDLPGGRRAGGGQRGPRLPHPQVLALPADAEDLRLSHPARHHRPVARPALPQVQLRRLPLGARPTSAERMASGHLQIRDVEKTLRHPSQGDAGVAADVVRGGAGRVRLAGRPVRLRQVDAAVHRRRARGCRAAARCGSTASAVRDPGPDRGMVFQNYTLFPWLTVLENARFARRLRANALPYDLPADAVRDRVERVGSLLELMGLRDFGTPTRASCRAA